MLSSKLLDSLKDAIPFFLEIKECRDSSLDDADFSGLLFFRLCWNSIRRPTTFCLWNRTRICCPTSDSSSKRLSSSQSSSLSFDIIITLGHDGMMMATTTRIYCGLVFVKAACYISPHHTRIALHIALLHCRRYKIRVDAPTYMPLFAPEDRRRPTPKDP